MGMSDDFADDLVANRIDLERFSAATRRKVKRLLEVMKTDLGDQIHQMDVMGVSGESRRRRRAEKLIADVERTIDGYMDESASILDADERAVAGWQNRTASKMIDDVIGAQVAAPMMTSTDLEVIVDNKVVLGGTSEEYWNGQSSRTRNRFAREIRTGVSLGETNDQLIQRIRGKKTGRSITVETREGKRKVPQYSGGVLDITQREAESLVRTSVQTVSNEVIERTYKNNGDLVKGVAALTTLDGRTTPVCTARTGASWNIATGEPLPESSRDEPYPGPPPWHFQCRTTLTPVIASWSELVATRKGSRKRKIAEAVPTRKRASMDGEVPADITITQWYKRKGDKWARNKLGNARFTMWKEGKITLHQLVDQSGRPLTIEELEALAA